MARTSTEAVRTSATSQAQVTTEAPKTTPEIRTAGQTTTSVHTTQPPSNQAPRLYKDPKSNVGIIVGISFAILAVFVIIVGMYVLQAFSRNFPHRSCLDSCLILGSLLLSSMQ